MLECNLCKRTEGITHLTISLHYQETELDGQHIHICSKCQEKYYGKDVVDSLQRIDKLIISKCK